MDQNKMVENVIQKKRLLQKYYEMACHNLMCYSRNYLMELEQKEGFETEWKQANEECLLLQEMMDELDAQGQKEAAQKVPVHEQLKVVTVYSPGIISFGNIFRHSLLFNYIGSKLKIHHATNDRILIFDLEDKFIGEATAVEN